MSQNNKYFIFLFDYQNSNCIFASVKTPNNFVLRQVSRPGAKSGIFYVNRDYNIKFSLELII